MKLQITLVSLLFIGCQIQAQKEVKVLPINVEDCPVNNKNKFPISLKLEDIGDGKKAFTGSVEFLSDFNNNYMAKVDVDVFVNNMWIRAMSVQDTFCNYLNNQLQNVWTKVREASEPPIEDECDIKAGLYKLDKFEADQSDAEGLLSAGHYRGTLHIMTPKNEQIACIKMEGKLIEVE